jgi:hypothetical protein
MKLRALGYAKAIVGHEPRGCQLLITTTAEAVLQGGDDSLISDGSTKGTRSPPAFSTYSVVGRS